MHNHKSKKEEHECLDSVQRVGALSDIRLDKGELEQVSKHFLDDIRASRARQHGECEDICAEQPFHSDMDVAKILCEADQSPTFKELGEIVIQNGLRGNPMPLAIVLSIGYHLGVKHGRSGHETTPIVVGTSLNPGTVN